MEDRDERRDKGGVGGGRDGDWDIGRGGGDDQLQMWGLPAGTG